MEEISSVSPGYKTATTSSSPPSASLCTSSSSGEETDPVLTYNSSAYHKYWKDDLHTNPVK